jgi:hypothetical protein
MTLRNLSVRLLGAVLVAACGDGSGPDTSSVDCADVSPTVLTPGQFAVVDAAEAGCVQVPAAGPAGAEHLFVALSGQGTETNSGVTEDYSLTAGPPGAAAAVAPPIQARRRTATPQAARFHDRLRARERDLVARRPAGAAARSATRVIPPLVGDQRSFKVCAEDACDTFVDVAATARVVTGQVAIYLDDAAPSNGYTQLDLEQVGDLFDDHLYPIDTVAFGRESDLDDNDVVIVLLTNRVNQLIPNCNTSGSVVAGYFFGLDLLPEEPNSNGGEVFYGLTPDPEDPNCTVTRDEAIETLSPVFIHEFAHMIGFAQRVFVFGANTVEQTWLDEGLAHFAEELGGRLLPDSECQPLFPNCEAQFLSGNISNAYEYLNEPEESFLIEPGTSSGNLAERGANWLFVRWLADHYAASQPLGEEVTRALVQTTLRGAQNVENVTGESFDNLVVRWQLANFAEDLAGFTPADPTLQYTSWTFRGLYQAAFDDGIFDKPYPLTPDIVDGGSYSHDGVLRGGSGKHIRIVQQGGAAPVNIELTEEDGASVLGDRAEPRAVLLRIR